MKYHVAHIKDKKNNRQWAIFKNGLVILSFRKKKDAVVICDILLEELSGDNELDNQTEA